MSQKPVRAPITTDLLSKTGAEASLGATLARMTWPMVIGVVALMGYQLVDSIFVSMLGTAPLAALGFTIAINQVAIGIQVGLGIAATALISRAIGAGKNRRARHLAGLVLATGSTLMALMCLLTWLARRPILGLLDADRALWPLIETYWIPWLVSIWLGATLYFAYSIARAQGNTRLPGAVMLLTSVLNLVLDPVFIFGFGWGLPGAALASIAAFAVGGVIMAARLHENRWVGYHRRALPTGPALRELGFITGPAMLSQLMPGLAAMLATIIVAGFGAPAVAAWGLSTRLEFFSIVVVLGLTMSMPPMVGRYVGARDSTAIHRLAVLATRFILVFQLAVALLWLALSFALPDVLSRDPEVRAYLRIWFLLVPWSYGALGTCMILVSMANAMGMPLRAVLISMLRLFAFYLPALWLGAVVAGMTGVYAGAFAGNLAAGLAAWALYKKAIARLSMTLSR